MKRVVDAAFEKKLQEAIEICTRDSDMFSYSGPIQAEDVNKFMLFCLRRRSKSKLSLFLTTYGGDPHSAYRFARTLQSCYSEVRLLVVGPCKSAGTLIAIGANSLSFGSFGELGPLDMQVAKSDDLVSVSSGLDTFQAFSILRTYAFSAFESYMLNLIDNSGGTISTRTACDVASHLVTGLFSPMMAQLDPQRMGEMQRAMDVAKAYGERLDSQNLRNGALGRLIESYPSHAFIIDPKEARSLFKNVSDLSEEESTVMIGLQGQGASLFAPSRDIMMFDVSELLGPAQEESENEAGSSRVAENPRKDDEGERREVAPSGAARDLPAPRKGPRSGRGKNPRGVHLPS